MFRSYRDLVRTPPVGKKRESGSSSNYHFSCDMCESKWLSETDVEIHKREEHSNLINEYIKNQSERFCTICVTLFESYSKLLNHIKTYHLLSSPDAKRVEREIFVCNECQSIFFNKGLLIVHIMYFHLLKMRNKKKYNCPRCNRKVKLKMTWHHFQCHDIPSVSFCEICLVNQPSIEALMRHLDTHNRYYKCEQCNYRTTKQGLYYEHLRCHMSKRIKSTKSLNKLMKTAFINHIPKLMMHNSLKGMYLPLWLNICVICRAICTDKVELKMHLLKDHLYYGQEERKKNKCDCGEVFTNKILLKQHILKMGDSHKPLEDNEEVPTEIDVQTSVMEVDDDGDEGDALINVIVYAEDGQQEPQTLVVQCDKNKIVEM